VKKLMICRATNACLEKSQAFSVHLQMAEGNLMELHGKTRPRQLGNWVGGLATHTATNSIEGTRAMGLLPSFLTHRFDPDTAPARYLGPHMPG
jgi:hypothetical protein